jgi:hypothetical protein
MANEHVKLRCSAQRLTGVLSLTHHGTSQSEKDIGVERVEIWTASRRPGGLNYACEIDPPLAAFAAQQITNGVQRPTNQPNAWVAALRSRRATPAGSAGSTTGSREPAASVPPAESIALTWNQPQSISRVELFFDVDYDHPMETVQFGHPESIVPFCVKHYRLLDATGSVLHECPDNRQARNTITLAEPITTDALTVEVLAVHGDCPAAIFEVRCYGA